MSKRRQSAGKRLTTITIDQAISSASNVLIAVLAARVLGVESFGYFGIVFLIYVTVQGASRALAGEPLLVRPEETQARPGEAIGTAMLLGLGFGVLVVAAGATVRISNSDLGDGLVVLGVLAPLLLIQDVGRYLAFATHRPGRAVVLDCVWLGLLAGLVGWLVVEGVDSLGWFVAAWAGSGAVAGVVTLGQHRAHRPVLGLTWLRESWAFSWRYSLSFAAMQSAALGVSIALVAIAGARALGAVRGALLLLGPFVQFQAAAIAAGVAEVSRMDPRSKAVRRHVRRTTLLTTAVATVNAVILVILPDAIGEQVLGATWTETEPLLWPASVQMIMLGLISGTRSALLGLKAVRRTTCIDILTTALTLGATVIGALLGGAIGAFWALAGAQGVVAAVWWISFLRYQPPLEPDGADGRTAEREAGQPIDDSRQDTTQC